MWKLKVPFNVSIFAWRFILGRLPTRDQLKNRGILVDDRDYCCVLCFNVMDSSNHLFELCPYTIIIWYKVGVWLGILGKLTIDELKNFGDNFDKFKALEE